MTNETHTAELIQGVRNLVIAAENISRSLDRGAITSEEYRASWDQKTEEIVSMIQADMAKRLLNEETIQRATELEWEGDYKVASAEQRRYLHIGMRVSAESLLTAIGVMPEESSDG